jgi:hypothetical protein
VNSLVEKGLVEFLSGFFEANEISAVVHAGTSNEAIPPDDSVVIVSVKECQHVVGPLYNGMLEVIVSTPAVTEKTVEDHRLLVANAEDTFDPDHGSDVSAAVVTAANCSVNGWFYHGPKDSPQNERWTTVMSFTLGLVRN